MKLVAPVVVGVKPDERARPRPTESELALLLEAHSQWLVSERKRDSRPNFSGFDFSGMHFEKVNLSQADLNNCTFEGAVFLGCDLSGANLSNSIFRKCNFTSTNMEKIFAPNADFSFANFSSYRAGTVSHLGAANLHEARLSAANFTKAVLNRVNLTNSDVSSSIFDGAQLFNADLRHCKAQLSSFCRANLKLAKLQYSDFRYASLQESDLDQANFEEADLRNVKGCYFLSDNFIRYAKFSPNASDPYSMLRKNYTGYKFAIILVLTIVAISPYFLKALTWDLLGKAQIAGSEILTTLIAQPKLQYLPPPPSGDTVQATTGTPIPIRQTTPNSSSRIHAAEVEPELILPGSGNQTAPSNPPPLPELRQTRVLWIVLGLEEPFPSLALSSLLVLLFYNCIRGLVTINVSRLREAEERSSHSPGKAEYFIFYKLDRYVLRWLSWLALVLVIVSLGQLLWGTVYVFDSRFIRN